MSTFATKFGLKVREAREGLPLKQSELASKIGVSQSYLSKVESGHVRMLNFSFLEALSKALHIPPSWLM